MFFIDKYKPKTYDELYFHINIKNLLLKISQDKDIPNFIFYGPEGSGKTTLINMFLEMIFDNSINNIIEKKYEILGNSNKITIETIKQSQYHIIIESKQNNNSNNDKYIIQSIIKNYLT